MEASPRPTFFPAFVRILRVAPSMSWTFLPATTYALKAWVFADGFEVRVFSHPLKVFESLCHCSSVCVIAQAGLSNDDLSRSRLRNESKRS